MTMIPAKHFAPAKSIYFPLIFSILQLALILIIYFTQKDNKWLVDIIDIGTFVIWLASIAYFIYKWITTSYELKDGHLFYRSGFTKGSFPISSIRKIDSHSRAWGNDLAALTNRGLMISYNKWDEVFIAPKDQDDFLKELLICNPNILIKDHLKDYQSA